MEGSSIGLIKGILGIETMAHITGAIFWGVWGAFRTWVPPSIPWSNRVSTARTLDAWFVKAPSIPIRTHYGYTICWTAVWGLPATEDSSCQACHKVYARLVIGSRELKQSG